MMLTVVMMIIINDIVKLSPVFKRMFIIFNPDFLVDSYWEDFSG